MAKFSIRSMVLSIADEAIDRDLEMIAEKIFPTTRICRREVDSSNVREGKRGDVQCWRRALFWSGSMPNVWFVPDEHRAMHRQPCAVHANSNTDRWFHLAERKICWRSINQWLFHLSYGPYRTLRESALSFTCRPCRYETICSNEYRLSSSKTENNSSSASITDLTSLTISFCIIGIIGIIVSKIDTSRSILKNSCGWNRRCYRRKSSISAVRW